jgi:hypothetical protein
MIANTNAAWSQVVFLSSCGALLGNVRAECTFATDIALRQNGRQILLSAGRLHMTTVNYWCGNSSSPASSSSSVRLSSARASLAHTVRGAMPSIAATSSCVYSCSTTRLSSC